MNFKAGDVINERYKLIRQLGRGSFGEVWLADDLSLGVQVAIKIYIALDSRGLDEFKDEFKNVRTLNHPNLLRPDHYDNTGNSPYLIMTYCPESLGNKVGNVSEEDLWRLIYDIASGLEYLHNHDVIHRDIKPDNILQNGQGEYVITDFGLSQKMRSTLRRASARNNQDKSGSAGTIGYMAPEMFTSNPTPVKATDIWALGATIFETATGEMPFCGQGGVMELHGAELPNLPAQYSSDLSDLMKRCLAREPWDRPSAKEIAEIASKHLEEDRFQKESTIGDYSTPRSPLSYTSGSERDYFEREIKQLNTDLAKAKAKIKTLKSENRANGGGGGTGNSKLSKVFLILFIIFAIAFVVFLVCFLHYKDLSDKNLKESEYYSEEYYKAKQVLANIKSTLEDGSGDYENFGSWTSTNHSHSSTDYRNINFYGSAGEVITFDYDVDSESYDHFKAILTRNGSSTTIKDVSGLGRRGSVDYSLPGTGDYTLRLEYTKDSSIHSGRDNVRVTNIRLVRSPLSAIQQLITDYYTSDYVSDYEYTSPETEEVECVEEVAPATEAASYYY